MLLGEVHEDVDGIDVTMRSPGTIENPQNILNLFLYQVTPNNGYSNLDLPARSYNGNLSKKPLLGLDLYYLLTAFSINDDLVAHRILASAMRFLHENPVLTREVIHKTIAALPDFEESDLEYQIELIKLSYQPLSLEELTKLWSSFFQTQYRVSVAYQATVVLLDGKKRPRSTLPVLKRNVHLVRLKHPIIDNIEPQIIERTTGAKITIIGQNLQADDYDATDILFDNIPPIPSSDVPQPDVVTDERIVIEVPLKLKIGIKKVQVIHKIRDKPTPLQERFIAIRKSNEIPFVLSPKIVNLPPSVSQGSTLTIEIEGEVSRSQKVEFLIGDFTLSVLPESINPTGVDNVSNISVTVPKNFLQGGPSQQFLFRIRIDGAESFLQFDVDQGFTGPIIEVTPS
jgi:hypothetical protein